MKKLILLALIGFSTAAQAAPSVCVLFVDGGGNSKYSCDGADAVDLYSSSGVSAALSKSIPYFMAKGYTLTNCSDAYEVINNTGMAYTRCYFVKN